MQDSTTEEEVVETLETLRQLCICIENYQNETEPYYFELLTRLSSQYHTLQQLQDPLLQVDIPFEVLELVDQEQNPDQFVEKLEQLKSVKMDQYLGKQDAIDILKNELQNELQQLFPEEMEEYKQASTNQQN